MIRVLVAVGLFLLGSLQCVPGISAANTLEYPVDEAGYLNNYYKGRVFFAGGDHLGEDINLAEGTPIRAIGDGKTVVYRASDGYGELAAVVEHDLGAEYAFINAYGQVVRTRFILSISGHIRNKRNRTDTATLSWKAGDAVSRGDVIGYINDDAHNGDGEQHLHEGVRLSNQATAQALDPSWFRGYERETDQGKHFSSPKDVIRIVQNGGIQQLCSKFPSGYILCWNPSSRTQVLCREARAWTLYRDWSDIIRLSTNQYCPSSETVPLYAANTAGEVFGSVGGGGTGQPPPATPLPDLQIREITVHKYPEGEGTQLIEEQSIMDIGPAYQANVWVVSRKEKCQNGNMTDNSDFEVKTEILYKVALKESDGEWQLLKRSETHCKYMDEDDSKKETVAFTVPPGSGGKNFYIKANVDATSDIVETNEGNNWSQVEWYPISGGSANCDTKAGEYDVNCIPLFLQVFKHRHR